MAQLVGREVIVENLSVTIQPSRHYPIEKGIRILRVTTKVNGREHFLEKTLTVNDLVSYFDSYWEMVGRELKEYLKEQ